jgi:PAS domain S-box-containing protein
MFGFKADEMLGQDLHSLIVPDRYHKDFKKGLGEFQKTGQGYFIGKTLETAATKQGGTEFPVEISLSSLQVKGDWYAAGIIRDITERKEMEKQMKHMAHYDMLTGLPNRTLFFDRFAQFLSLAKRHKYVMAILYLDLDKFKDINDTLGHGMGDRVLKEVANRLNSGLRASDTAARMNTFSTPAVSLRDSDTVARIGGDEFIVLLSQITDENDSAIVAERFIRELTQKIRLHDHEFTLSVSIGISEFPRDGETMEELAKNADIAMYRAKARGGNCFEMFSAGPEGGNGDVNNQPQNGQHGEEERKTGKIFKKETGQY